MTREPTEVNGCSGGDPAGADPTFERLDRRAGRTLVVRGELDLASAHEFRRELRTLISESRSPAFVDLSEVTFFDSSSISVLIDAHQLAPSTGSALVVVSPSVSCRRVFDVLGLADVLDIRETLPDA